jgi:hypothetical protein
LAALATVRPLFARDAERRVFGLRPVAVDGTWTITPHEASTKARWPQPKLADGRLAHHPQALLVIAFELFSRLPIGLAVMGHKASEHLAGRLKPSSHSSANSRNRDGEFWLKVKAPHHRPSGRCNFLCFDVRSLGAAGSSAESSILRADVRSLLAVRLVRSRRQGRCLTRRGHC